ncbi:MAG: archease [Deltaproteobacteria bacterium]|nr:archease [Deltaproteobacteria bacterium]
MTLHGKKNGRGWRFLEHTADIRIEMCGTDLKEVFVNAAFALSHLLGAKSDLPTSDKLEVDLEADGYEDLLVEWLRELLYRNQTSGFLVAEPRITTLTPTRVKATLRGRHVDMEAVGPDFEIKGVTYHGLSIRKDDNTYTATVVFDI